MRETEMTGETDLEFDVPLEEDIATLELASDKRAVKKVRRISNLI